MRSRLEEPQVQEAETDQSNASPLAVADPKDELARRIASGEFTVANETYVCASYFLEGNLSVKCD